MAVYFYIHFMTQLNNLKRLKQFRKNLRNNSTPAEATLWKLLKGNQLGRKFRRQHSFGPFILDFYCPSEKLAVELDGAYHFTDEGQAYDKKRTAYLNSFGIRVIRFENVEVFDAKSVAECIKAEFSK